MTHFPKFWGKKIFLAYMALSCTTSYGFLAPCQNLEKTNDAIPRKCPDKRKGRWNVGRTDERTDRPNFIGLFQLLLGSKKGSYKENVGHDPKHFKLKMTY